MEHFPKTLPKVYVIYKTLISVKAPSGYILEIKINLYTEFSEFIIFAYFAFKTQSVSFKPCLSNQSVLYFT